MYYNNPPYNVIKGENDSLILEIAAPGFSKENILATFEDSELIITAAKESKKDYIRNGVKDSLQARFTYDENMKIDMVSCKDGIISVLASKKIPTPNSGRYLEIL